ncbi:hypothetical protein A7X93_00495 [Stenotrophomonas maltophilia]|uniref:hypothetical protein n=1 Tax=Stenotrophomonas maltophilia TaxID=40324 RepID=UPI000DA95E01|nr:hypothetical protein [Stenotrophomonas maltophilia]PZT35119.1 hypothetical protein A7X93_00495 [Stenotrophomonas maltophilia]
MNDIEKRARDLLAAEVDRDAAEMPGVEEVATSIRGGGHGGVLFVPTALRAIIAALTPPEEPDQALLVSMAVCLRHGFAMDTPGQQQSQLREMRKLWDEVMGQGYYSPNNRERYTAMLAARPEVP